MLVTRTIVCRYRRDTRHLLLMPKADLLLMPKADLGASLRSHSSRHCPRSCRGASEPTHPPEAPRPRVDPIYGSPADRHKVVAISPSPAGRLPTSAGSLTLGESDWRSPFRARLASSYRLRCKLST